jgi:phosphopantothenate-cysteine ligase/phosphopantothenoylcysteine decarboxylase/phosphopantothenate--cysteine ligase
MKILVTAGNTQTPIDQVRCITNIFSGKTGAQIARTAFDRGHDVTLFTSHPEALDGIMSRRSSTASSWSVRTYRTFEDLESLMNEAIPEGGFNAIIHAAAVSDYSVAGVFAKEADGQFADVAAGKVKGSHPELWLRLVRTPKLVDRVRRGWQYSGILVKFKLEVGVSDEELLNVAETSRVYSGADLMIANTLEGMHEWAFVGAKDYLRIRRAELATELMTRIETFG